MFGLFTGDKIKKALRKNATILDVRTVHEYDQGRIRGSVNIPLDRIASSIERIRGMKTPIIVVCNSGTRSANAIRMLKQNGLNDVYNGGNWEKVLKKMNSL